MTDLAWLFGRFREMHEQVYVLPDIMEAAIHPPLGMLPWPVLLWLGTRSKKHVVLDAKQPHPHKYNSSFLRAEQSLLWRDALGNITNPWWQFHWGHSTSNKCNAVVLPEVRAFANEVRDTLAKTFRTSRARPSFVKTRAKYESFAAEWLATRGWTVLQTDKDGGFCLVRSSALATMLKRKLQMPFYREIPTWQIHVDMIVGQMCSILGQLEKHFNLEGFKKHYVRTIGKSNKANFVCKILATMKTHKAAGAVDLRVIHSGAGHPFGGISKFVAVFLKRRLYEVGCVSFSTDDVIRKLRSLVIPEEHRHNVMLGKLDVKDFYMQGSASALTEGLFRHVQDTSQRQSLEECLNLILSSQYIRADFVEAVYSVCSGSGMGKILSGDVADLKFYDLAESDWADDARIRAKHKIWLYTRYRDDIFIMYSDSVGPGNCETFVQGIIDKAAQIYKVVPESFSKESSFLDIFVYKPASFMGSGKLAWRPFIKASAQKLPLSHHSIHNPVIHTSWPLAEISRIYRRSWTEQVFSIAKSTLLEAFSRAFMHEDILCQVKNWKPHFSKLRQDDTAKPGVVWIVVPYRPLIAKLSTRALGRLVHKWTVVNNVRLQFIPKISWSKAGRSVAEDLKWVQGI